MNSQSPPRLPTWVLQKLTGGYCCESLEGDLLEAWRSGRGNAWYWRQVHMAVLVSVLRTVRAHGLSFALAVSSFWVTIWLSRFGNREVFSFMAYVRREIPEALGSTPFTLEMARFASSAIELAWFAIVFMAQGYVIGRLHRRYVKTAALTAIAVFVLWPNAPNLIHAIRSSSVAGFDGLWLIAFFAENVICVLLGAAWLAKRWPPQRAALA